MKGSLAQQIQYISQPSLYEVQELYRRYSILSSRHDLMNNLFAILDIKNGAFLSECNPWEIYNYFFRKFYMNEAVIKSEFAKNVLFKSTRQISIFELSIGTSRVDLCSINRLSIAYEIKTEFDNYSRLDKQIKDYQKVFDRVYVICPEDKIDQIVSQTHISCGIYFYRLSKTGSLFFRKYRSASEYHFLDSEKQLSVLSKSDLVRILHTDTGFSRADLEKTILTKWAPSTINYLFKKCLKDKYQRKWQFLKRNQLQIFEVDYQWFFKNNIEPFKIYQIDS